MTHFSSGSNYTDCWLDFIIDITPDSCNVKYALSAYVSMTAVSFRPYLWSFSMGFCALGSQNIAHYVLTPSAENLVYTAAQTVRVCLTLEL